MRAAPAGLALAVALTAGACGRTSPDLFVLERSGSIPGARLHLRVHDDGLVRCNRGAKRRLPDQRLLEAREIARGLERPAERGTALAPGRGSILRYRLRLEQGTVTFADTSRGQVEAMFKVQRFARRVARETCGLAR
jgi:hypothetical protein